MKASQVFLLAVVVLFLVISVAIELDNPNKQFEYVGIPEGPSSTVLELNVSDASNYSSFSEGDSVRLKIRYYTSPPPPRSFVESLYNLTEGDRIRISSREGNWTGEYISSKKNDTDQFDQKISIGNSPDWNQTISFLSRD